MHNPGLLLVPVPWRPPPKPHCCGDAGTCRAGGGGGIGKVSFCSTAGGMAQLGTGLNRSCYVRTKFNCGSEPWLIAPHLIVVSRGFQMCMSRQAAVQTKMANESQGNWTDWTPLFVAGTPGPLEGQRTVQAATPRNRICVCVGGGGETHTAASPHKYGDRSKLEVGGQSNSFLPKAVVLLEPLPRRTCQHGMSFFTFFLSATEMQQ